MKKNQRQPECYKRVEIGINMMNYKPLNIVISVNY
jgi:hypothetical protein